MSIFVLKKFQRPSLHLFDTGLLTLPPPTALSSQQPHSTLLPSCPGRAPTLSHLAYARWGRRLVKPWGTGNASPQRENYDFGKIIFFKNNVVPKFPFKVKRSGGSHCSSPSPAAGQSQGPLLSLVGPMTTAHATGVPLLPTPPLVGGPGADNLPREAGSRAGRSGLKHSSAASFRKAQL